MAEHKAVIVWTGRKADAETLLAAISPDDPDSFTAVISELDDGVSLTITAEDEKIRSLRATLDDLLACLSAAESAITATEPPE